MEDQTTPRWFFYLFALRDQLPLDEAGWSLTIHDQCPDQPAGSEQCTPANCQAAAVQLWQLPGQSVGFADAMRNLTTVSLGLTGKEETDPIELDPLPQTGSVALVGSPAPDGDDPQSWGDHYERCFGLLHDMIKGLRLVTNAWIPNVSIERVWPMYFRVRGDGAGSFEVIGTTLIEHGFRNTATATHEQLFQAIQLVQSARAGDPLEIYRDFKLSARNAAWAEGDYVEAVLKASVAAEILIKHASWMVTWEATTKLAVDPHPGAGTTPLDGRPRQLLGGILAKRLMGNWSSQTLAQPVGAWRHHIARRRNAVIHRGFRPGERGMPSLMGALDKLETHILDRLAANAAVYPRTCLMLLGQMGLERRKAWSAVETVAATSTKRDLLNDYLAWLAVAVPEDDLD